MRVQMRRRDVNGLVKGVGCSWRGLVQVEIFSRSLGVGSTIL